MIDDIITTSLTDTLSMEVLPPLDRIGENAGDKSIDLPTFSRENERWSQDEPKIGYVFEQML